MPEMDDILSAAHDAAYRLEKTELCRVLSDKLGRLTLTRIAGVPDANTISRWSAGRSSAQDARLDRIRHSAYLYNALVALDFSPIAIRQWFRAPHPALGDDAPMDVIARGDLKLTLQAVRQHRIGEKWRLAKPRRDVRFRLRRAMIGVEARRREASALSERSLERSNDSTAEKTISREHSF